MKQQLRNSGIDIVGEIPWGTHFCQFYSSKDDFKNIVGPYINAGLESNELCIWIYSEFTEKSEIKSFINRAETYIQSGQLLIVPHWEWYKENGEFNHEKVNRKWLEKIGYALKSGYSGLRAVGDAGWIEKEQWKDFSKYEENMVNIVPVFPFLGLCLYNADKCGPFEYIDVAHNHGFSLVKNNGLWEMVKSAQLSLKEKELEENRRQLNQTIEYDKLKTEFFSNISHELRTPLSVILSTMQLLDSTKGIFAEKEKEKSSKYANIMRQNCYRLLRMINNLIDITRIDSDYFHIEQKNQNIVAIVEEIILSVKDYIENKGISFEFSTNVKEKILYCDADQIERIILNLLSNSIKFTKPGGRIWVSLMDEDDDIRISVKDTGKGIPKDKLSTIFERFQQVDKSLTREQEGSGIGLSLVKSLVEKHGGDIKVKSEYGKGSEFIIKLPAVASDDVIRVENEECSINKQNYIHRINIEFSDIYN